MYKQSKKKYTMILIYRCLGILLIPFIFINVLIRIKKGKENKFRYRERFGKIITKRPNKKLIWIHAASIGEFKSADLLINSLYKKYTILITTTTLTAGNFANKYYGTKIIHQFAPLDIDIWVRRFLNYWKPNLIIWIESDLWPVTLTQIKDMKIKSLLINVRMSPKSYNRWKNLKFFYKQITSCFDEITAQSEKDKIRISKITKRNIRFIGNLKLYYDKKFNKKINQNYSQKNNYNTLMFASTHKEEELKLILLIKKLIKKNNLKIIIAPRHVERSKQILLMLNKGRKIASLENKKNEKKNNVLIVNSFGNLSKYFIKSNIVFLGGSLTYKGGHNPIEPSRYNCAIITGPHTYNWQNIYEKMASLDACIKINNIKDLENKINFLINDKKFLKKMIINSKKYSRTKFFDSKKLFQLINTKISEVKC